MALASVSSDTLKNESSPAISEFYCDESCETVGELPQVSSPTQVQSKRLLRQGSVSENFFAVKGAALIVPRQTSVVTENMQILKHYGERPASRNRSFMRYMTEIWSCLLRLPKQKKVSQCFFKDTTKWCDYDLNRGRVEMFGINRPRYPIIHAADKVLFRLPLVTLLKINQGELQIHLKAIFHHLRPQDNIKLAARLESWVESHRRYLVVVSTTGRQDTEESIIIGCDFVDKDSKSCTIGLVVPVWCDTKIQLDGDGGFRVECRDQVHTFKPVSVQAMWSALQALNRSVDIAQKNSYYEGSLFLTWTGYYVSKIASSRLHINEWTYCESDLAMLSKKSYFEERDPNRHSVEKLIRNNLKHVMMKMDLDNSTSKQIRNELEKQMDIDLREYKEYIDTEMLVVLGQLDTPSKILDYLYLGSEMNASNFEELKELGVTHILNVTIELINFYPDDFCYKAVRLFDNEDSKLLPYWNDTYKFISKARQSGGKCLVHCRMGISRSSSTVCAYLMKEKLWTKDKALEYVKDCRSIICPNDGFLEQLDEYEGIVMASAHRHNKLFRSRSESTLVETTEKQPVPSPKHQSITLPTVQVRQSDVNNVVIDGPAFDLNRHLLDVASLTPPTVSRPKSWSPNEGRSPYIPSSVAKDKYLNEQPDRDTSIQNHSEPVDLLVPFGDDPLRKKRIQDLRKNFSTKRANEWRNAGNANLPVVELDEMAQSDDSVFVNVCAARSEESKNGSGPHSSSPAAMVTDSSPLTPPSLNTSLKKNEAGDCVAISKKEFTPGSSSTSSNTTSTFVKGHHKSPSLPSSCALPVNAQHGQMKEWGDFNRRRSFSEVPTSVRKLVTAIEEANVSKGPADGFKRSTSLPSGRHRPSHDTPTSAKFSPSQHIEELSKESVNNTLPRIDVCNLNSNNSNNVVTKALMTRDHVTFPTKQKKEVKMSAALLHAIREVGGHLMAAKSDPVNSFSSSRCDVTSKRGIVRNMVRKIEKGARSRNATSKEQS